MTAARGANLALKFLVELAAFAAFAIWGASIGHGAASFLAGIAAPAVAIVLWGVFAAPRSERRLSARARVPFELAVFGLATLALVAAGHPAAGIVFAGMAAVNAAFLSVFGQWEA